MNKCPPLKVALLINAPPLNKHPYSLQNRKHVPYFYRVIETRVKVMENEKCCENTSHRWVFPQLFKVLPNFHKCFNNSIETQRTCRIFLLENTVTHKSKSTCLLWSPKCWFSLLALSLCQQLVLKLVVSELSPCLE